jgi:hypothetical protein
MHFALQRAATCSTRHLLSDEKNSDSISQPLLMGTSADVCSINAAGADNKYMISTYSPDEWIASPQEAARSTSTPARAMAPCLRSMRRQDLLQNHRGDDVPRLRPARAEGANYLLIPHHSGQT